VARQSTARLGGTKHGKEWQGVLRFWKNDGGIVNGRKSNIKGFKVTKTKTGRTVLEPIACYGKDVSAKIRMRNSKRVRVTRRTEG